MSVPAPSPAPSRPPALRRLRAPRRADALVRAQGLALAGLAWPGRARWRLPRPVLAGAVAALGAGGALAASGGAVLGRDLTPFVDPRPGAELRTHSAYRFTRHPLYLGMLMAGGGAAVLRRRPEPLVGLAVLSGVLHVKASVEERRLADRFGPAWAAYACRTPRLVGMRRRGGRR
ncbi:MAG: methyltransferase [Kineosporiaceae bacterium]